MAEYNGVVSAATRADVAKLNTALSKVHPELDQRGKQRGQSGEHQNAPGPKEHPETAPEEFGLEPDHALQAFNAFLERDSVEHPEHRQDHLISTINQVKALTKGIFVYDDDEIVPVSREPETEV